MGVIFSVILAILFHPWTWNYLLPQYWQYIAAITAVIVLNKVGISRMMMMMMTMMGRGWGRGPDPPSPVP